MQVRESPVPVVMLRGREEGGREEGSGEQEQPYHHLHQPYQQQQQRRQRPLAGQALGLVLVGLHACNECEAVLAVAPDSEVAASPAASAGRSLQGSLRSAPADTPTGAAAEGQQRGAHKEHDRNGGGTGSGGSSCFIVEDPVLSPNLSELRVHGTCVCGSECRNVLSPQEAQKYVEGARARWRKLFSPATPPVHLTGFQVVGRFGAEPSGQL